jgi:excisionase family DNA binding protein
MKTNIAGKEEGTVRKLLKFQEAAEILNVSLRQFRRLVDAGKVPVVRLSSHTPRIRLCDLERYIESSMLPAIRL